MYRISKEEWERRKSYLIRSLFEDLPVLSPIYESQEPTQSSSGNDIHRPESPLPDLIIEKEPPREIKYHQDEPEEFYDKLAREMRKRYKRDFLHLEKDSTTSSDTTNEIRNESHTQIESLLLDEERSLEAEESDKVDVSEEDEYYSEMSNKEETQKTRSTSSDNDSTDSEVICSYEQITCEALVHANYEEITDQPLPEMIHASEGGADPSDTRKIIEMSFASEQNEKGIMGKHWKSLQVEGIGLTDKESFANLKEANQKSFSPTKSPDEFQLTPEIMRRHQTLLPDDTLSHHDIQISGSDKSSSNENLRMELASVSMERFVASGAETEVSDASLSDSNIVFTMTSTPKSSEIRRSKIVNKRTSRLVPYSLSSSGSSTQKSKRHVALQTSFSDDEPDFKDFWNNFFVGTPIVYNICTCRNHVCS